MITEDGILTTCFYDKMNGGGGAGKEKLYFHVRVWRVKCDCTSFISHLLGEHPKRYCLREKKKQTKKKKQKFVKTSDITLVMTD